MSHEIFMLDGVAQFAFSDDALPESRGPWWEDSKMKALRIPHPMTVDQVMHDPPLLWLRGDVVREGPITVGGVVIPDSEATLRVLPDGRKFGMGVTTKKYPALHERHTIFPVIADLVGDYDVPAVITLGVLGERTGHRTFLSIRLPDIPNMPEPQHRIICAETGHDGATPHQFWRCNVVPVCANTVRFGKAMSSMRLSIRHSRNQVDRLEKASEVILADERVRMQVRDALQGMAQRDLNVAEVNSFLEKLFPRKAVAEEGKELRRTRTDSQREAVLALFEGKQQGAADGRFKALQGRNSDAGRSAYAMLMAATEWLSHERPMKGSDDPIETFGSTLWGSGSDIGDRIWDSLTEVCTGQAVAAV